MKERTKAFGIDVDLQYPVAAVSQSQFEFGVHARHPPETFESAGDKDLFWMNELLGEDQARGRSLHHDLRTHLQDLASVDRFQAPFLKVFARPANEDVARLLEMPRRQADQLHALAHGGDPGRTAT